MKTCQLAIIGGGPAGLAAACAAYDAGLRDILILERDRELGGILNQCIHNGFGLHHFKEELTGPEYAGRFIRMLRSTSVRVLSDTMVLDVTPEKHVCCVNTTDGYQEISAQAVVLAKAHRHSRLRRHRPHHGAAYDARGREGARLRRADAVFLGSEPEHRAVPA